MKIKNGKALLKKGISPTRQLENLFFEALKETTSSGARVNIYPSDSLCPRKSFLMANTEFDGEIQPKSNVIMSYGNLIQDLIEKGLYNMGEVFACDYRISPDEFFDISGKIDFVLKLQNEYQIVELKTRASTPRKPLDYQVEQAYVYSAYTGITNVLMIYINRVSSADLKIRAFDVSPSRQQLFDTVSRIFYTQKAIRSEQMPLIPEDFTEKDNCRFCPFSGFCWNGKYDPVMSRLKEMHPKTNNTLWLQSKKDAYNYLSEKNLKNRKKKFLKGLFDSDSLLNKPVYA